MAGDPDFFLEHRIWLTSELASQVAELNKKLRESLFNFQRRNRPGQDPGDDRWDKAWKLVEEDAKSIREALEEDVRGLIGVE